MHPQCVPAAPVQPAKSSGPPIWAVALGGVFVLGFVVLLAVSSLVSKGGQSAKADVEVDAKSLYDTYSSNEARGDVLYKGKNVRVRGVAGEVSEDILGDTYVEIRSGSGLDLTSMKCELPKRIAADIRVGKPITIQGRVEGKTLNTIYGRDCWVVSQ